MEAPLVHAVRGPSQLRRHLQKHPGAAPVHVFDGGIFYSVLALANSFSSRAAPAKSEWCGIEGTWADLFRFILSVAGFLVTRVDPRCGQRWLAGRFSPFLLGARGSSALTQGRYISSPQLRLREDPVAPGSQVDSDFVGACRRVPNGALSRVLVPGERLGGEEEGRLVMDTVFMFCWGHTPGIRRLERGDKRRCNGAHTSWVRSSARPCPGQCQGARGRAPEMEGPFTRVTEKYTDNGERQFFASASFNLGATEEVGQNTSGTATDRASSSGRWPPFQA